jgi:glycosyltransferase involved in cell wall biosynthesis
MTASVLIVIPVLNEAANLESVLSELRAARPQDDVLVVDDGSRDDSADRARALGCFVLRLPFNLGYGAAVQAGIKYGLRHGYACVTTFDGDGQHDPLDIAPLVSAVAEGADLAIGSRFLAPGSYKGGLLRRAGRVVFAGLCRALTGLALNDPTSGLKALSPRGQALFALARFPDRYPDADALVVARRSRLVLTQRPARMRRSRNTHSMHDGHRAIAYAFNMTLSLLVAAAGRESDLGG